MFHLFRYSLNCNAVIRVLLLETNIDSLKEIEKKKTVAHILYAEKLKWQNYYSSFFSYIFLLSLPGGKNFIYPQSFERKIKLIFLMLKLKRNESFKAARQT